MVNGLRHRDSLEYVKLYFTNPLYGDAERVLVRATAPDSELFDLDGIDPLKLTGSYLIPAERQPRYRKSQGIFFPRR